MTPDDYGSEAFPRIAPTFMKPSAPSQGSPQSDRPA